MVFFSDFSEEFFGYFVGFDFFNADSMDNKTRVSLVKATRVKNMFCAKMARCRHTLPHFPFHTLP